MSEPFDETWPGAGWDVFDRDGMTNGEYVWGATACFDHGASGDFDALAHAAGTSSTYTCWQPYPHNMDAWMIYGPFDLSTATEARLLFDLWLDVEKDYDTFFWGASSDGNNFSGFGRSVDTSDWEATTLDLTQVPLLGDLTGEGAVWIAFVFQSDVNNSDGDHYGAWIDDVLLQAR
jgi:hypothetical protein